MKTNIRKKVQLMELIALAKDEIDQWMKVLVKLEKDLEKLEEKN